MRTARFQVPADPEVGHPDREAWKPRGSVFGLFTSAGPPAQTRDTDNQVNNIDISQVLNTSIKSRATSRATTTPCWPWPNTGSTRRWPASARPSPWRTSWTPKRDQGAGAAGPKGRAAPGATLAHRRPHRPGQSSRGKAYYGYYDEKTFDRSKQATFTVDLDKQIAVTWQFSPSTRSSTTRSSRKSSLTPRSTPKKWP